MGLYDETVEPARRTMTLFFLIDTSGSMTGSKIGAVNNAIDEVLPTIRQISDENADAQIKVAAMTFSTDVKWVDSEPVAAENFRWNFINANGLTSLGAACNELNDKLSRKAFMQEAAGSYAPVLFLMSDGEPTDNWENGLNNLKQNNWYKAALKVAIAIGDDANKSILSQFTGSIESVITVHTPEELKKWIKFVSVRSSQIGSKSTNSAASIGGGNAIAAAPQTKQEAMIDAIKDEQNKPADEPAAAPVAADDDW